MTLEAIAKLKNLIAGVEAAMELLRKQVAETRAVIEAVEEMIEVRE